MATDFKCPHCSNLLNVGENIVFTAHNKWGKEGLIMLHPELGNYTVLKNPNYEILQGDKLEFYCLYCGKQLLSDKNPNLVKILMSDDNGQEYEILFSRISGEHATFKIIGENYEIFGKDASQYIDSVKTKS
jgi:transcription elongation factor Elf1